MNIIKTTSLRYQTRPNIPYKWPFFALVGPHGPPKNVKYGMISNEQQHQEQQKKQYLRNIFATMISAIKGTIRVAVRTGVLMNMTEIKMNKIMIIKIKMINGQDDQWTI